MGTHEERYRNRILEIMDRRARGEASEEELCELDKWYTDFPSYKKYAEDMTDAEKECAQRRILEGIQQEIEARSVEESKSSSFYGRRFTVVLVSVFLIAGILTYRWYERHENPAQGNMQAVSVELRPVLPGGNKAILTLADGSRVSLTDAPEGSIATQGGVSVLKAADGQLVYNVDNSNVALDIPSNAYNKIETPRGGQYRVRLPDGTVVWMNAASSLRYPAHFAAKGERRVELSGEAYFEVAKDRARPFIVSCGQQNIEVLGTHFNVNAYPEDKSAITTLLEGSVRVSAVSSEAEVVLKPGQQSVQRDADIQVKNVNADYAVSWKEGYFRFNGKDLDVAMKEIARWYDVEIRYKNPSLKSELLAGTISKYSHIQQVLEKMELAGAFHFSIESGEIIVE